MKAKTTLKTSCRIVIICFVFCAAGQAFADTFTVTSPTNSGPNTLRWAIDQVNTVGASQHRILFADGITQIGITFPLPSITRPVQIDGGGDVIINGGSGSGDGLVLAITTGTDFSRLYDITITNFPGSGVVIDTTRTGFVQVDNATIVNNGANGILVKASKDARILDNPFIAGNGNYGVYVRNGGLAVDVWDSYVFQNDEGGIYLGDYARGDDAAEIARNSIYWNGQAGGKGGVQIGSHGSLVEDNYVFENDGPGMTIEFGQENRLRENHVFGNTGVGISNTFWAGQIEPELEPFVINPAQETVTIPYSLDTADDPDTFFELDFFVSLDGEGAFFLGTETFTSGNPGTVITGQVVLPWDYDIAEGHVVSDDLIVATATSYGSDRPGTSEFSVEVPIVLTWDGEDADWGFIDPGPPADSHWNGGELDDLPSAGIAVVVNNGTSTVAAARGALSLQIEAGGTVNVAASPAALSVTQFVTVDGGTLEVDRDTQVDSGSDFIIASGGKYSPQIGETSSGLVAAGADVDLKVGSELQFRPTGASPFKAGTYTIITAAGENGIVGTFSTSSGLGNYVTDTGLTYFPDPDPTEVRLVVDHDLHMGDADMSTATDLSDFNIWNANKFTQPTDWYKADFNGDGGTDLSDFNLWNANKFTQAAAMSMMSPLGGEVLDVFYDPTSGELTVDTNGLSFQTMIIPGPEALSNDRWLDGTWQDNTVWLQRFFGGKEQWWGRMHIPGPLPDGQYQIATYEPGLTAADFGPVEYMVIEDILYADVQILGGAQPPPMPVPEPGVVGMLLVAAVSLFICRQRRVANR